MALAALVSAGEAASPVLGGPTLCRMAKTKQTRNELVAELCDQIELLMLYCTQFDAGRQVVAKPMATCLRVLLHSKPKGNSRALLDQLSLRAGRWRNAAALRHPRDDEFSSTIVGFVVSMVAGTPGHSSACIPLLPAIDKGVRRSEFSSWWLEPVAFDRRNGKSFSRMDIVLHVADTNGGAHVDSALDESYVRFRSGDFLGVRAMAAPGAIGFGFDPEKGSPILGAPWAAIRTIAHEVLLTIQDRAPAALRNPYVWTNP